MEKKKPTYDLDSIKKDFSSNSKVQITCTALNDARSLGFLVSDIIEVVMNIKGTQFVKSMTSHSNHAIWQDVYNVPVDERRILYIKFTEGTVTRFKLLSFKEV